MPPVLEVLDDANQIVERARSVILEAIAAKKEGPFSLVVEGGLKTLYQSLAQVNLDWSRIHIFFGDERFVPPTDPQSNEGMVRWAWLNQVPLTETNIHPMATAFDTPQAAATAYEQQLENFFGLKPPELPVFDLIVLGMGDDGHTASLFPGTGALNVTDRWVTVGQKEDQHRLTLTYPVINRGKQIIFLVSGANKHNALKAVHAESGDSNLYPSRLIQGNVLWLVDRAAYGEGLA